LSRLGNKRAKELGLANCRFQEGDAANLHQVPEQAFELFVSIFGAMFHCAQAVLSPSQRTCQRPRVAKEAVRVTQSGGRIIGWRKF
jgi:ubiquinone/menaquinone biosynthesis C-methylase UbiE